MRKITLIAASLFLILGMSSVKAQENSDCSIKYNLFRGDFKAKNYDGAYDNWLWCLDNCPTLSVNIYKNGVIIAKDRYSKASEADKPAALALVKRVFDQRIKNFPKDLGKVYSDYAKFIGETGASDDEVFAMLEKAYKADPTRMGVKSIYKYFQGVTDRNKDTNAQLVFDTYDDVLEAVGKKMKGYSQKLENFAKRIEAGEELGKKDAKKKHAYEVNLRALGQVEGGLDAKITEIATCERLIPLYTRDLEKNKNNAKWLKRAVSRLYNKKCTEDPLYETLVEAYVAAEPSPEASVFFAGILLKKGNNTKAMEYFMQAVAQETDPFKKADHLYKIAQIMKKRGRKSEARSYAYKAIKNRPSFGKAYLLIADMYARSANNCGTTEFEKRMVYVAALNKAIKAKQVDPGISSTARKYIKNYLANSPSKKLKFTEGVKSGDSFKIGCWIGETVKIP